MGRLDGKVALISGAGRGQGAEHARRFVAEGARVVLGDILDDEGRAVAATLGAGAHYVHLDVTSEADWAAAIAAATGHYGRLDTLINNAGVLRVGGLADTSVEDYLQVIRVNQLGCFLGMRSVIGALTATGGGSIINTSSIHGLQGVPGLISYVASKFAIRGMTKAAALELGHAGIRVNSVHPGLIDTAMINGTDFPEIAQSGIFDTFPIPRVGTTADVANLMVFLASDESSYCTGGEFVVDGGSVCGPLLPTPSRAGEVH
ncbi:MAG: 3alpha(or 20beta)-hydroxysteroid dehydrogenase [Pseudonocardiales bacterium]|jgi:3alpha(or 20beta)-hydroxysteroid dehydrogenase|nr:3alpha(or 20beta)-hydroxysteroid dehydrogenase [Pseudonocardiales bacterium]